MSKPSLEQWYAQLAAMLQAGLSLPEALVATPLPPRLKRADWLGQLRRGSSWDQLLAQPQPGLPEPDRALLRAGGETGRLPEVCLHLATQHGLQRETRAALWRGALYPLVLIHLAAILLPLPALVMAQAQTAEASGWGVLSFNGADYLVQVLGGLAPLWLAGLVLQSWADYGRESFWRLLSFLPLWRSFVRRSAWADFAGVLGATLGAGVGYLRALELTLATLPDVALRQRLQPALAQIERGTLPSVALTATGALPADVRQYYLTGEQTGQLEAQLARLQERYSDEARSALGWAIKVYGAVLVLVAFALVTGQLMQAFQAVYLEALEQLLGE